MAGKKKPSTKRFIDNDEVKRKVAELHMLQLQVLLERLESGLIEPQEMRIIWDITKHHGIGLEGVEDLVKKALDTAEANLEDLEVDEEWSFGK